MPSTTCPVDSLADLRQCALVATERWDLAANGDQRQLFALAVAAREAVAAYQAALAKVGS